MENYCAKVRQNPVNYLFFMQCPRHLSGKQKSSCHVSGCLGGKYTRPSSIPKEQIHKKTHPSPQVPLTALTPALWLCLIRRCPPTLATADNTTAKTLRTRSLSSSCLHLHSETKTEEEALLHFFRFLACHSCIPSSKYLRLEMSTLVAQNCKKSRLRTHSTV